MTQLGTNISVTDVWYNVAADFNFICVVKGLVLNWIMF
jgi:hypothetical protein